VFKALKVLKVLLAHKDNLLWGLKERRAHKEHKERRVLSEHKVPKDLRVLQLSELAPQPLSHLL
jgi:hypothetical protein